MASIGTIPKYWENYREILLIPLAGVLQCCRSADAGWECYFICVPWNFCTAESNCDLTCAGLPWAGRWRVCVWDQHELKINMSHLEMLGMTSIHSSWLWKNFRAVILCSAPSTTHTHAPWWSLQEAFALHIQSKIVKMQWRQWTAEKNKKNEMLPKFLTVSIVEMSTLSTTVHCRTLHVPAECWSCSVAHYWVAVWPPVRSPQPGHSQWPAQHCRDSELIIRLQRRLLVTRAANDLLVFTITEKASTT